MKTTLFLTTALGLCLLPVTQAVSMNEYRAESGVDAAFEPFLEELYASAEDPGASTGFTDYFTNDGTLIVLENTAQGADAILRLKQALLPVDGLKQWNHFPNTTTLSSETATYKTYQVFGAIQTTFTGGNCSLAFYQSRFTVTKDNTTGSPNLIPVSGSLVSYDDYVVSPARSPTDIPCTKGGSVV
ncbi:hypothetical protein PVAG01_00113 [Phlyctema vagabunda]|uniref:Uncharacterized protein n=1 Tax=Phlyctema vagabunda TaxID=108571 RepID=A0ABR4PTC2_9HELO